MTKVVVGTNVKTFDEVRRVLAKMKIALNDAVDDAVSDLGTMSTQDADAVAITGGDITDTNINMDKIGTPTYDDLKGWWDGTQSAGIIDGGSVTDAGSGKANTSELHGIFKTTDSATGENRFFKIAAQTDIDLTDNSINYIIATYHATTPTITASVTNTSNGHTIFALGKVYREGDTLDIINSGLTIYDVTMRAQEHHLIEAKLHFVSGATVSATGTRNIAVSAGIMYAGNNKIATLAMDSNAATPDTFEYYYYNGSAWVESDETQIDNQQYNNTASGLADLSNNKYGVHWVFKGTDKSTYVVYGQGNYTLTEAQNATVPASLPTHISECGVLRAKIILEEDGTVFEELDQVSTTMFNTSSPSNHNDLGSIDGGAADEYYHLTSAQHAVTGTVAGLTTTSTDSNLVMKPDGTGGVVAGRDMNHNGWIEYLARIA